MQCAASRLLLARDVARFRVARCWRALIDTIELMAHIANQLHQSLGSDRRRNIPCLS